MRQRNRGMWPAQRFHPFPLGLSRVKWTFVQFSFPWRLQVEFFVGDQLRPPSRFQKISQQTSLRESARSACSDDTDTDSLSHVVTFCLSEFLGGLQFHNAGLYVGFKLDQMTLSARTTPLRSKPFPKIFKSPILVWCEGPLDLFGTAFWNHCWKQQWHVGLNKTFLLVFCLKTQVFWPRHHGELGFSWVVPYSNEFFEVFLSKFYFFETAARKCQNESTILSFQTSLQPVGIVCCLLLLNLFCSLFYIASFIAFFFRFKNSGL